MAYIGNSPAGVGNYQVVDDISSTFNGTLTSFALTASSLAINPAKSGQLLVSINGVLQEPDDTGTEGFKVSGSNIVFSSAPATGSTFWAVWQGQAVDIGTPSDGTVGTAQMSSAELALTGGLSLGDNVKANFGASDDLQIYHDGSNSYVDEQGTGILKLRGSAGIALEKYDSTEQMLTAYHDDAVTLFHNGSSKLATTSAGIDVTGVITTDGLTTSADISLGDNVKAKFGASNDLQIYHDGSNSYITDQGTGSLMLSGDSLYLTNAAGSQAYAYGNSSTGGIELRYGNNAKLSTTSTGVDVTGSVTCDGFTSTGIDDNATSEKLDITDTAVKVGTAVNLHTDYTDTSGSIIYTRDNGSSTALADPNYYALQISNSYTGSAPLAGQKPAKIQFSTVTSDGYGARGSIALVARGTAYGEGDIVISTGAASSPANHSTETVRFPSSGGIRFNGDTSTANSLDDYEEGGWTPGVLSGTVSVANARYIKVGKLVTVSGHVQTFSDITSGTVLTITGLPFTSGSTGSAGAGSIFFRYINHTYDQLSMHLPLGSTNCQMFSSSKTTSYVGVTHAKISSAACAIYFSLTYTSV